MTITVFTPTYNRKNYLPRLYVSLINQIYKDFVWLIIDDGSNDGTDKLVHNWINENLIKIIYYFKTNEGKHTAMKLAYEKAETKYLTAVDSDDTLLPEALQTFYENWLQIENEGLETFFSDISALTIYPDGRLVGNFYFNTGLEYIDSTWQIMTLKLRNYNETIPCWNLCKLREVSDILTSTWLSDKISYLSEIVVWARLGRKFKTRYINKALRIYYTDAEESLMRSHDIRRGYYNNLVGYKYFLDENVRYFFLNPKYFLHLLLKCSISGMMVNISPLILINEMKNTRFKLLYLVCFPISIFGYIYFKYIKRGSWL